ncbi:MAG: dimethylhistidine N-methyltransferase [Bradymonadia bacterium]|jgi:dimethylhistidine N-methyltransferase
MTHPDPASEELLARLRGPGPKRLSPKWFYDARGSVLFDQITTLDAYYLTRIEHGIMRDYCAEMALSIGPTARLLELGSGSSEKTHRLLEAMEDVVDYVPLDISSSALDAAAVRIRAAFPELLVQPIVADYSAEIVLPPPPRQPKRTVAFFSGSTIGNFMTDAALEFLKRIAAGIGPGGGLIIAVDQAKDPAVLHRAYDDEEGVTAAFNMNALRHINSAVNANFDLEKFKHEARVNESEGRVEMHLVSLFTQDVTVAGETIHFEEGESIHSESSHKWKPANFERLLERAGFVPIQHWNDEKDWYRVYYAEVPKSA